MRIRTSALFVALWLALVGVASGQGTTGTLAGRLVDGQGLAVPGAKSPLPGPQGTRTFVSDGEGMFQAPFLVPGS